MTGQAATADWRDTTPTEALVDHYVIVRQQLLSATENLGRTERAIIQRLEADGASVLDHPEQDVTLERPNQWDRTKLYPLAEHVPPEVMEGAFTAAHDETIPASVVHVPDKWDMRKVLALAKYGAEVQRIIEAAKIPGAPKLSITPKKAAS